MMVVVVVMMMVMTVVMMTAGIRAQWPCIGPGNSQQHQP
jgi:hypothetical protein